MPDKKLIYAEDIQKAIVEDKQIRGPAFAAVMRHLSAAPAVDAVEVVHGRWIAQKCDHVPWRLKNPEKWVIYNCSVCGYSNGRKHSNYCPNCGAKMDGGNEDV